MSAAQYTNHEIAAFARRYEKGGLTAYAEDRIHRILKTNGYFKRAVKTTQTSPANYTRTPRLTPVQRELSYLAGPDGYLGDGVYITDF